MSPPGSGFVLVLVAGLCLVWIGTSKTLCPTEMLQHTLSAGSRVWDWQHRAVWGTLGWIHILQCSPKALI